MSAGFLQNAAGVTNGLVIIDLIAEEGHIDNHQGPIGSAGNHTAVVDHLVEGDGQAIGQALNHHSQRIAHQKAVDTCLVEEQGGGVVVGGEHGNALAGPFCRHQVGHGHFVVWIERLPAHWAGHRRLEGRHKNHGRPPPDGFCE